MKMMKLLTFALAGLAFVSCAKMEPAQVSMEPSNELITFTTPISAPLTKGDEALEGIIFPTTWNFDVQAVWYNDATAAPTPTTWNNTTDYKNYITRQVARYGDDPKTAWYTNSKYYWPKNGKLAFMAFYPEANAQASLDDNYGIYFNYTTTPLAVDGTQKDLMYSNMVTNATKAIMKDAGQTPDGSPVANTYNGVQLMFNHVLSSLVFTAKTEDDYDDVVIKIQSIVLKNVKKHGHYSSESNLTTWTTTDTEIGNYNNIITSGDIVVNNSKKDLMNETNVSDLLVMPQNFISSGLDEEHTSIEINYTINQHNEGDIPQTHVVDLSTLKFKDGETYAEDGATSRNGFEIGKKYIFNIIIALDQIYFSPEVKDWTPITAENIKVE